MFSSTARSATRWTARASSSSRTTPAIVPRPARIRISSQTRSYAASRSNPRLPEPSGSSAGTTIAFAVGAVIVGGVIISRRGKVVNEAVAQRNSRTQAEEPIHEGKEVKPAKEEETSPSTSKASSSSSKDASPSSTSSSSSDNTSSKESDTPKESSVPEIVKRKESEAEAEEAIQPGDAANQGAFNEETGEINWDCPCLGGMAHGPCGEEFKAAFSCFVFSEAEPKGMDCVEKFKGMQDCFRQHPEIYGEEIDDDEEAQSSESPQEGNEKTGEDVGAVDGPKVTAQSTETSSS